MLRMTTWAILLLLLAVPVADASVIYDNIGSPGEISGGLNITYFASADDFRLDTGTTVTGFTFWAILERGRKPFPSSIGWALYHDASGAVGAMVASGTDSNATVTDVGDWAAHPEYDILKVEGEFSGSAFLGAGNYWVSFRDGPWGVRGTGADFGWAVKDNTSVYSDMRQSDLLALNDPDPTFPNSWSGRNGYFQLHGDGGNVIPEPATIAVWSLLGLCGVGYGVRRRTKKPA